MYAPDTSHLQAEREHIAANVKRLRAIVESPAIPPRCRQLEGERLQRVPRGFPKDHAAADYLKYRQFLAGQEYPARFACSPRFYTGVVGVFREVAPLDQVSERAAAETRTCPAKGRTVEPTDTTLAVRSVRLQPDLRRLR